MTYITFAWIASILFGTEAVIGKLTSKYSMSNPWLFTFVWNFIILVFTLIIALYNHVTLPTDWGNIILVGIFYALGSIFYTLALFALDLTILSPMFNFRTIMSVLLGVVLLGQTLSVFQYMFIGTAVVAGFFVSLDEHMKLKSFFTRSIMIALCAMLGIALEGIYTNKAMQSNSLWTVTLWSEIIGQIVLLGTIPKFWKDVKRISIKQVGVLSIMSVAGTTGLLAANMSYAGNVGIASTIISLPVSMIMAFVFAVFAPKLLERHPMKIYAVRFVGAAVMFYSAYLLSR